MEKLLLLIGGTTAAVVIPLAIVFAVIRRQIDRAAEAVAAEGVELDSGRITVTVRFKEFRTERFYRSGGLRRNAGRFVLTKRRLYLLGLHRYKNLERAELGAFTVGILDGKLHLHSTTPPGATGSIDFRAEVPDAPKWVAALTAAGARSA